MTTSKFKSSEEKEWVNKLIDKNPGLEEQHVEFILWIEQYFLLNGRLPTHSESQEFISVDSTEWSSFWKNNAVRSCLLTRGVPLRHPEPISKEALESLPDAVLSYRQLECIKVLYDPNDMRPDHTKLKKLGIKTTEYEAWRRDPAFLNYAHQRASNLVKDLDDDAYRAFADNVRSGDHNAIKMFFEMKGIYRANDPSVLSLQTVIQQIIDIIQREITDPGQLQRISGHIFMALNQQTVQNPNLINKAIEAPVEETRMDF